MVPFRMRGSQRTAWEDDQVVLSGLSEEVGGWGEGAGCWEGGREEEVSWWWDWIGWDGMGWDRL